MKIDDKPFFGRYWNVGWVKPTLYYKPYWFFGFAHYENLVWKIMVLGFYLVSTNAKSVGVK